MIESSSQTDVSAAIFFLKTSRRPAYNAIHELEQQGLVHRVIDKQMRRRRLLRITRYGWDVLVSATADYSDLVVEHVRQIERQQTNWIEFVGTRTIEASSSPMVSALCHWSTERGSEPIPTKFLDRIYVLDMENPRPEAFKVSFWGRGMKLQGGRDFTGQNLVELQKSSSKQYWQSGVDGVIKAFDGNGSATASEISLRSGNIEHTVHRVVVPDKINRRAIIGTWIIKPDSG